MKVLIMKPGTGLKYSLGQEEVNMSSQRTDAKNTLKDQDQDQDLIQVKSQISSIRSDCPDQAMVSFE